MIEEVSIKDVASYSSKGETLQGLKEINFIYGGNGSGKTTISRVIGDCSGYPNSSLKWKNDVELNTLVYNQDFIDKNFNGSSELQGIFTLGEDSKEIYSKIDEKNKEIDKLSEKISKLHENINGENGFFHEKKEVQSRFVDVCWNYKQKYDSDFAEAFSGLRSSKEKFKEKVLEEQDGFSGCSLKYLELKEKGESIFSKKLERIDSINSVDFNDLILVESNPILKKKIVGKDDVDLTGLIKKLNNSDWVSQGVRYLHDSENSCPFCQQKIDNDLRADIEGFFDEEYDNDMRSIQDLLNDYIYHFDELKKVLGEKSILIDKNNDSISFEDVCRPIKEIIERNISKIEKKKESPSLDLSLNSIRVEADKINSIIEHVQDKIEQNNSIFDNLDNEKVSFKSDVWAYVCSDMRSEYEGYKKELKRIDSAILGASKNLESLQLKQRGFLRELSDLQGRITSIEPTINGVNDLLGYFGFNGFKLSSASKEGFYSIVRPDGSHAESTLSEGEKTFITFLYFYYLLRGGVNQEDISRPKVVVLDDPVSSLDSDVLFIVSSLIKNIIGAVRDEGDPIKQFFVLTHNIYFHKEVTHDYKRKKGAALKDETFWLVRKVNELTQVKLHTENPVQTHYELLWKELAEVCDSGCSGVTIQNVLRRILENYFKIMGGVDLRQLIKGFDPRDQIVLSSLLSWVNDGSHFNNDDLYVATDSELVDRYLKVFKQVFEKAGHIAHWEMMMGESELQSDNKAA